MLSSILGLLFQCKSNSVNRTDSKANETLKYSKLRFEFYVKGEKHKKPNLEPFVTA